ncbi:10878_t:CDS:1, partial [Rhizophagus irregularis]
LHTPVITAQDLILTDISSNKVELVRIPNAFIAYKMALVRQLKSQKVACHQSNVSLYLWAEEPEDVKNTYQ